MNSMRPMLATMLRAGVLGTLRDLANWGLSIAGCPACLQPSHDGGPIHG